MFVSFIFFVLVGLLGTEVTAQSCSLSVHLIESHHEVDMPSACAVFNITVTRNISGSTVSFLDKFAITTIATGFQCKFYDGTSTSAQELGTIGASLVGYIEIFVNSTDAFVQCVGNGSNPDIRFLTASGIASERFQDQLFIQVQTPGFLNTSYPNNYIQETVIESSRITTYNVSFHSTFFIRWDPIFIIADDGTELVFIRTSTSPDRFNITGRKIIIQFISDDSVARAGFRITLEADVSLPLTVPELICSDQGQVNISLSNQTVKDLCGSEDDYVIISAIPVDDVNSVDPECIANGSDPNFSLVLSQCSILEVTNGVLEAHFPLRCLPKLNESEPIQRYTSNCFNLTCEYNRTELLEAGAIVPEIKKVALDSVEQEGRFGVKIYFTKNQSYSDKLDAGAEVKVPDLVYTKVELSTPDEALHVQLKECWATPSEDPDDEETRYEIIKQSCPVNNSFESDDAIEIDRNYLDQYAGFHFKSFVWSENEEGAVYVYCRVTICHEDVDSTCPDEPNCAKKRKRDVASSDSLLVASGPIFISKSKKKSCEESNGGCSDVCEMRNDDVICMCYDDRFLVEDGKTCQGVEKYEVVAVGDDWTFLVYVIAAFVIVVGCLFVWSKKDGKNKDGLQRLI
ncbi:unnamed protein product [Clavelina lepadiformis]|uniref:ZP domain-containing protein n=1 Tax=Clavelina lepadiformis TaxID=159417 RepID=A0ABP0FU72_CLALP